MSIPDREDWLPVGEEPHPGGSITHLTVVRSDGVSVLSAADGDIDAEREPSSGLYYRDARHLSRLLVTFGGVPPILLDSREVDHGLSAVFTNPAVRSPGRRTVIPAQSLVLRRRRVVSETLLESLSVSNYGRDEVEVDLRIEFEADFCDIFVVRGLAREASVPRVQVTAGHHDVTFTYMGADSIERSSIVSFQTPPAALAPNEAVYVLRLQPRETATIDFQVHLERRRPNEKTTGPGVHRIRESQEEWLKGATAVETDNEALNDVFLRALLDIEILRTSEGEHEYVAAGVPWYDTLFGRDSLITGIEMLAWRPSVLRSALLILAANQAVAEDPAHDASPGKIPHELRWGELANIGEVPFGRYYGSVDGTPLFIAAAAEYYRWTADETTVRRLWPSIERAMEWCISSSQSGVDGFLAYSRRTAAGLENQGWKDSHDAITWPDGRLVEGPIALVEVQGYLAAAYASYAWLARTLRRGGAADAEARARDLRRKIHERFSSPEIGYVLCLDGSGTPVPTPASNGGHLLWSGVATPEHARDLAARFFAPDMFSGWGIRTLSSAIPGYNPIGYHVGSVWPHDNAMILRGLRMYAFDEEADRLASAMFDMALGFPGHRVPELFSGDDRGLRTVPTPYPVASRPQAWAAAAVPYTLTTMLGVQPGRDGQLCVIRPRLPASLREVRLTNVHVGHGSADLTFRRIEGHVSVEVEAVRNGLEVSLSNSFLGPPEGAP